MAKWCGNIGFVITTEDKPGIWKEKTTIRKYHGELIRNTNKRYQTTDSINDNIVISNSISIIADPYVNENFSSIRYVEFMGAKWKVSNCEIQYPRLILSLGDLYNA